MARVRARAVSKHIRMSARKVRLVVDLVRGKPVNEAAALLEFSTKAAAAPVSKTLLSAIANARDLADSRGYRVDVDDMRVLLAYVDEGRTQKRWKAAAMGRAAPRRRRTSHITVVVESRATEY